MKHWETTDPEWGRILHLSDGKTEVSAALDFGIRVVGLSAAGEPNLFYRQPEDDQEYRTLRFPGSFRKRAFLWSRRIRGSGSRSG